MEGFPKDLTLDDGIWQARIYSSCIMTELNGSTSRTSIHESQLRTHTRPGNGKW
jgi:hypothetical protein